MPECQQRGLSLLDDLEHYFHQDEFSALVQAWNEQRSLVLKEAVEQFLQPHIFKEIQEKLLDASQQAVVKVHFCSPVFDGVVKRFQYLDQWANRNYRTSIGYAAR